MVTMNTPESKQKQEDEKYEDVKVVWCNNFANAYDQSSRCKTNSNRLKEVVISPINSHDYGRKPSTNFANIIAYRYRYYTQLARIIIVLWFSLLCQVMFSKY